MNPKELLYIKMSAKGWYPAEQTEKQKINQVKQKFAVAIV